jgi:hypothetical protein
MANDEHVALLKQGVAGWNAWRDENPDLKAARLGTLGERLDQDRRSLEHPALGRAHHAIDDTAVEQLTTCTDSHPAIPGEPTAVVQRLEEPRAISDILDGDIDVYAIRSRHRRAGILAVKPGARRSPCDMMCAMLPNSGITDMSAGQKPPACAIRSATAGGMPLVSQSNNANPV